MLVVPVRSNISRKIFVLFPLFDFFFLCFYFCSREKGVRPLNSCANLHALSTLKSIILWNFIRLIRSGKHFTRRDFDVRQRKSSCSNLIIVVYGEKAFKYSTFVTNWPTTYFSKGIVTSSLLLIQRWSIHVNLNWFTKFKRKHYIFLK